ncbi:single-stranded DNA-binding protein [Lederbergia lenta]|uniref:Single-stranded DNA-binding protein n=1 Tax=Lederbergia lenta TaxID=1467 RepID=A0A2X4WLC2_LEDLE|nr:single-stranded DNA-binding protein [Lederbergia lenta]MCM3112782.1 single-stranded DNA-binding protein [Lederbergia lenta]MEC2326251.1 single-stranded DNA-binding protein [Lederbergia lenta]SQI63749.1 single-stranded DNA-binding protein [Lederbergia lenta]
MMNRVVLVGRLTKDPDLRYTPNGVAVANFTLAVNRTFTNQQGEREADFINCVIWRKPAENVANYLKKGSLAGVDGRIQTRNFEGQDGKRVYITEVMADSVQFLEPRSAAGSQERGGNFGGNQYGGEQRGQENPYGQNQNQRSNQSFTRTNEDPFSNDGQPIDISDDDLPF